MKLKHLRREKDGRVYVRRNGRSIRLRSATGSDAFIAEYAQAIETTGSPKASVKRAVPGSFAWLTQRYFGSVEFQQLAPHTKGRRRNILEGLVKEHGHKPFEQMQARHVKQLRDALATSPAQQTIL